MESINIRMPAAGTEGERRPMALAMAYIPDQPWETPYEPEVGLQRGTIFPSLDLPFIGEEAVSRARR